MVIRMVCPNITTQNHNKSDYKDRVIQAVSGYYEGRKRRVVSDTIETQQASPAGSQASRTKDSKGA